MSRFNPYEFQFTNKNLTADFIIERLKGRGVGVGHKVCFVGASHSKLLLNTSYRLLKGAVLLEHVKVVYADELSRNVTKDIIDSNCTL